MKDKQQQLPYIDIVRDSKAGSIRDYVMYLALAFIVTFFTIYSNGRFLTAGNISNLMNQSAYVAVLAIGMTIILILRHIDLSVGFVAGFTGAIAAILMSTYGWTTLPAVLAALCVGLAIGFYQGFMVAYIGIPAFVITLAGMFIFRGALNLILQKTGTIVIPSANADFKELSQGFIPDFIGGPESAYNFTALLIGIVLILAVVTLRITLYRRERAITGQHDSSKLMRMILSVMIIIVPILFITLRLASFNGIPISMVVAAVVLIIYNFLLQRTTLGRHIYGIGGNAEAAELSGVNVRKVTLLAFASMSLLAALSGLLFTSRLSSATPTAGTGFEMDAIASSYIGGVAVSGGVGRVTNTIVGTLVITSLTNGLNLAGVDIAWQYVIKGVIFTAAVTFDILTRRRGK